MSGVGSWIVVTVGDVTYKSPAMQGEFDREAMDAAMEQIYNEVPTEDRESVELAYASFLVAVANSEAEAAAREANPEMFMEDYNMVEDTTDTVVEDVTEVETI